VWTKMSHANFDGSKIISLGAVGMQIVGFPLKRILPITTCQALPCRHVIKFFGAFYKKNRTNCSKIRLVVCVNQDDVNLRAYWNYI
jgi:hypothetical protein